MFTYLIYITIQHQFCSSHLSEHLHRRLHRCVHTCQETNKQVHAGGQARTTATAWSLHCHQRPAKPWLGHHQAGLDLTGRVCIKLERPQQRSMSASRQITATLWKTCFNIHVILNRMTWLSSRTTGDNAQQIYCNVLAPAGKVWSITSRNTCASICKCFQPGFKGWRRTRLSYVRKQVAAVQAIANVWIVSTISNA